MIRGGLKMINEKIKAYVAQALAVTLVTGITASIPVEAKASTNDLISGDIKITAKSNTDSHDVKLAADGDKDTYWESSNHYRWVEIDLGATYNLSSIKVFNASLIFILRFLVLSEPRLWNMDCN